MIYSITRKKPKECGAGLHVEFMDREGLGYTGIMKRRQFTAFRISDNKDVFWILAETRDDVDCWCEWATRLRKAEAQIKSIEAHPEAKYLGEQLGMERFFVEQAKEQIQKLMWEGRDGGIPE